MPKQDTQNTQRKQNDIFISNGQKDLQHGPIQSPQNDTVDRLNTRKEKDKIRFLFSKKPALHSVLDFGQTVKSTSNQPALGRKK